MGDSIDQVIAERNRPSPLPGAATPAPASGAGRVIRVTDERDGAFAPRMMSDRANAWVSGDVATVFAGSVENGGARFYQVDLVSGQSTRLPITLPYRDETEGWYWTPDGKVMLLDGPRLRRVNPFDPSDDEVVLDISTDYPSHDLWQAHSSDDGQTHSATVRQIVSNGKYPYVATIVSTHGKMISFPAQGTLDESQVSRDGEHIVIKETPEGAREGDNDMRVIHLSTRVTQKVLDSQRAIGHSDCGHDFIVGEADKPDPGAMGLWDLTQPLTPARFRQLVPTTNMGYVSARAGKCLWSNDTHISLVALDGSGVTPLIEHGADVRPNDPGYYDRRPKANLSHCGKVATFMLPDGSVRLLVLP